jgi:hypothetical protein
MSARATPAPDIPLPALGPILRHEGRGGPIEIAGGRLETMFAQLAFLAELARAVSLNLQEGSKS